MSHRGEDRRAGAQTRMISLAARLLAVAAVLPALGCIQTATSGSVPADAVISIGLVSAGGLVPQTSAPVELRFSGLKAGPGQVLARRFAAPLTPAHQIDRTA